MMYNPDPASVRTHIAQALHSPSAMKKRFITHKVTTLFFNALYKLQKGRNRLDGLQAARRVRGMDAPESISYTLCTRTLAGSRYKLLLTGMMILMLAGCGRKEPPRISADKSAPPQITSLQHEISSNMLQITLVINGGVGSLGYQIDRAEIDPGCDCPDLWRRFREQEVLPDQANITLTRNINIRSYKTEHSFRIRAVDMMGNLSPWSKPFRARAEKKRE